MAGAVAACRCTGLGASHVLADFLRLGEGRVVKQLSGIADYVDRLSEVLEKCSDAELRAKTDEFGRRIADGAELDGLMPEGFAVAREAAWRVLGLRPTASGDGGPPCTSATSLR